VLPLPLAAAVVVGALELPYRPPDPDPEPDPDLLAHPAASIPVRESKLTATSILPTTSCLPIESNLLDFVGCDAFPR